MFHHIPCLECFYCQRKLYAQCPVYKKVGVTAGYEPAGGGFSQYVRVMDWIVERGVEKIPDGVPFDRARFVEPVNDLSTKPWSRQTRSPARRSLIVGQGPIGLMFTMIVARTARGRWRRIPSGARLDLSLKCGAEFALDPRTNDVESKVLSLSEGRGADLVIVAASFPGVVEQAIALLPARRANPAVCANVQSGAHRVLRRRYLRRRTDPVRLLQRLGGPAKRGRGAGL